MVRKLRKERMWGALVSGVGIAATVTVVLMLGFSSAVPSWRSEGFGLVEHGNAVFVELQNKAIDWSIVGSDGRYGWLAHGQEMKMFNGSVAVFGMEPESWFLVSIGSYEPATAALLGSVGFFGTTVNEIDGYGWADVAIFKTDAYGYARSWIPDLSWYVDVYGPTEYPQLPAELPAGTYTDVDVAVKYIGTGDTLSMDLLMTGGYQDDLKHEFNLYETQTISFTLGCLDV